MLIGPTTWVSPEIIALLLGFDVVLVANQTTGKAHNFRSPTDFGTLALLEDDWSHLADEQRSVFQSLVLILYLLKK
jgi:hypothetical protein